MPALKRKTKGTKILDTLEKYGFARVDVQTVG